MIGRIFANLKIVSLALPSESKNRSYICLCACGKQIIVPENQIRTSWSCGCIPCPDNISKNMSHRMYNIVKTDNTDISYVQIFHHEGDKLIKIDREDAKRVFLFQWSWANRSDKVLRVVTRIGSNRNMMSLSSFLLSQKGKTIHIDGDSFNYCKNNLKCGNKIRIDGNDAYVEVLYKKHKFEIVIDASDIAIIEEYNWKIAKTSKNSCYFTVVGRMKKSKNKTVSSSMAHILQNPPNGLEVDHIDGNTFNNRRFKTVRVLHKNL